MNNDTNRNYEACTEIKLEQGHSQNQKQGHENFMQVFIVDDVTMTSQIMTSYWKISIASEKIINDRVTFPSNHCC